MADKTITVEQIASPSRRPQDQRATLVGLGLNKIRKRSTLKVTQTGSPIGRTDDQLATLKGLGLNKRHRSRVLEDTPSVRGMINKVRHLVRVEEDAR